MTTLLIFLIRIYQRLISPALQLLGGSGCGCRFDPSCSEYFAQALHHHGFLKGVTLGFKRIVRCQPWGGCGHDPVPPHSNLSTHGS